MASKPGERIAPGTKARGCAPSAGERPACCPGVARCRGGVSSSWALAWNRRTCRPGRGGQRSRATVPFPSPTVSEALDWPADYLAKVLHGEDAQPHADEKHDPVLVSLASIESELDDLRERVERIERQLAGEGE